MAQSDLTSLAPPAVVRRAGWYPDPARAEDQRFWDGKAWTQDTRDHAPSAYPPLAVWGVIAGLLLPIAGVVIALILFLRSEVGPGLAALCSSALGVWLYVALAGG